MSNLDTGNNCLVLNVLQFSLAAVWHGTCLVAGMTRNSLQIGIAQLIHSERAGDWHDRPLRYIVVVGDSRSSHLCTQKWSTFLEAKVWASHVRRANGDWKTASDLNRATWN